MLGGVFPFEGSEHHMEGENIRRLGGMHGLTSVQVAKLMGVGKQSVSDWATGRKRMSRDHLRAAADLFGITMDQLVGDPAECLAAAVLKWGEAQERIDALLGRRVVTVARNLDLQERASDAVVRPLHTPN
jgi:transcriptional regulator with XRE-family HTH domain